MQQPAKARILFVDDEDAVLRSLSRACKSLNADILTATSGEEALRIQEMADIDIVVSDMRMPGMTGNELLAEFARRAPETIRMVLTGYADTDMVMHAVNEGRIWGYLQKPWDNKALNITLKQALQLQQVMAERTLMRRSIAQYQQTFRPSFEGFVGESTPMQLVYNSIERCAPSQASVFITGPSGAGKEVAAQAIHNCSKRKERPFIALNCAAIPSELMESEIFGHVKGAFSGAHSHRDGAASLADGGTLFLDELAEMDVALQTKLLRFIQTGTYQKVGSSSSQRADIRFICATNKVPFDAIQHGQLREDLYYRLNVISLDLPPLAQRESDVVLLAKHFLARFNAMENKAFVDVSEDAKTLLLSHNWPGNVRELQNVIHRAVVMHDGPMLNASHIDMPAKSGHTAPPRPQSPEGAVPPTPSGGNHNRVVPLADVERTAILNALTVCEDNVVLAASQLGVSPSTLYRKLQQWEDAQTGA